MPLLMFMIKAICLILLCVKGLRLPIIIVIISSPEPRLTGELIGYPWIRRRHRRRPSSVRSHFQTSSPPNRLANQSQILCGASLGRGNESLYKWSRSHDKMAATPIYGKNLKKSSSPEPAGRFPGNLVCSIGDSCPS